MEKLTKEIDTMLSFDHPNVMSVIGVIVDREMPFLIMPFMAKGSILEYVKHHKGELLHSNEVTEAEVCQYSRYSSTSIYSVTFFGRS